MGKLIAHIISKGYIEGRAYQENLLPRKHKELGLDVHIITSQLTSALNSRGVEITDAREYINKDGVHVHVLKTFTKKIDRYLRGYCCIGLYEKLCELSPDIIFVHNVNIGENRFVVSYVKKNPQTIVYADCHQDYYNDPHTTLKEKLVGFAYRINAKKLNRVTRKFWGTTPWRVDYLKDYYKLPPSKIDLLVMGGDEKVISSYNRQNVRVEVRIQYQIPTDAFLVVTGGIIDKRKQQDLLMQAVSEMSNQNVWLLLFGKPTKEMEPACEKYSKCNNIIFAGWVDADFSNKLFLASDLAVFPGTHSVLWEQAAACGLPQIIKHWKGMEHINVNGNAFLLDEITVENLKTEIGKRVFTDEYHMMQKKAAEASSSFSYIEIAKKSIENNY